MKKTALILILASILSLSACAQKKIEDVPSSSESVVSSVDENKEENEVDIVDDSFADLEKNELALFEIDTETAKLFGSMKNEENDIEVLNYDVDYIRFTGGSGAAQKANSILKAEAEEVVEEFKDTYFDEYKDIYEDYEEFEDETDVEYRPISLFNSTEVLESDDVISVVTHYAYDFNGAHPTTIRYTHTFDRCTGEEITAAEYTGVDEEELKKNVIDEWSKILEENAEDVYFDDAADTLKEYFDISEFYVVENELTFYMQLYSLLPYAGGYPEFIYKN